MPKTIEEIQKDFNESQNEIIQDIMGLFNRYYVKRIRAEKEVSELQKEVEKVETKKK